MKTQTTIYIIIIFTNKLIMVVNFEETKYIFKIQKKNIRIVVDRPKFYSCKKFYSMVFKHFKI